MRISEVERKETIRTFTGMSMGKTGNASFVVKCNYRDAYGRTGQH
jgi:hypothetical protein